MLHYEITGDGSPVVLLHEGIVDSRSCSKVVPLLAPHHTVVTYDQLRASTIPSWSRTTGEPSPVIS